MKVVDLYKIESFPYGERGKNVFYKAEEFKIRIISLSAGQSIPECTMASYVVFVVLEGEAVVTVNGKKADISRGKCLISEPATLSLETETGVRIMGLQINKE
ncbi:MAG: hypothetical protein ACQEP5_01225 [Actinomycetota bacterium]